jgi:hypothetical protein
MRIQKSYFTIGLLLGVSGFINKKNSDSYSGLTCICWTFNQEYILASMEDRKLPNPKRLIVKPERKN